MHKPRGTLYQTTGRPNGIYTITIRIYKYIYLNEHCTPIPWYTRELSGRQLGYYIPGYRSYAYII